jgi:hypothetical protein
VNTGEKRRMIDAGVIGPFLWGRGAVDQRARLRSC